MEIKLTQGMVALIDSDDFERVSKYKWCVQNCSGNFYASRCVMFNGKQKMLRMHRYIMDAQTGTIVDHTNRNTLDNRKSNLRFCSPAENVRNQGLSPKNTTGFRGVHRTKRANRFQAKIQVCGKTIYLGYFTNIRNAAKEYNEAAKLYFGEFAVLNKI